MHLHSLTFQAVGPFPGRHTIDLARLAAGGIFLLEGPTGAGKSTVIDMIVFALYGKVASRDASEDRLRSGHATPEVETFVDLVLETSSGVYRIRRTPQYQRPKQRGTGTTTQQASVRLWRLTSPDAPEDGELLSARLDEAGAELQRIVGLDRDQFVQTVVLPQGEFAGFLRAKPEDRRGLLQKVFGTGVYEQLQVRLERMRAEVSRQVEDAAARVRRDAAGFAGAADLAVPDAEQLAAAAAEALVDGGAALERLAAAHATDLRDAAGTAESTARTAKDACAATQGALDAERALEVALGRRARLREQHAVLTAEADEVGLLAARVERARAAEAVLPAVEAADRAESARRAALAAVDAARAEAPLDLRGLPDETLADALTAARDECTGVRAVLVRVAETEAGLAGRRAALAADEASCQDLVVEHEALLVERAARPDGRLRLEESLAEARAAAEGVTAAEAAVTVAEERLAAADEAAALALELDRARAEVDRLVAHATTAVAHEAAMRAARIAGIAGELATTLIPGEPCVVCGGTEHPAPAALAPDHVDDEQVGSAERARSAAEGAASAAGSRVAGLRERVEARRAAAGGADPETAKALLLAAQDVLRRGRGAARRRLELEQQLVRHDEATVALDQRVSDLAARISGERGRIEAQHQQLAADAATVAAELDGRASVAERVAVVETRAAAVTCWLEALAAATRAQAESARRAEDLAAALLTAAFPDVASVRAASVPSTEVTAWSARVEAHRLAVASVTSGLTEPTVRDLPEGVVADVEAALERHAAADGAATAAAQAAARLSDRARAADRALDTLRAALSAAEHLQQDAVPVVRMANLAAASGGDNAKQLTLATFVLARRFEDVVAAANARLTAMSGGRFELLRSEEKEAVRARRTGLAMKVVDHQIGAERDPRTLSGGETFYVSLCLALGLADVVTAEAGGTDLGTLFVDEGFGTLDPETLDVVVAELGRLREGGRVVGVVSHVDALKQSIAERIEVRRRPGGGSTLTVRA